MSETPTERRRRLRWLTLAEFVGVAAVIISGLALWNSWNDGKAEKPVIAVEQRRSVPVVLRGKVEDGGKAITLSPVEPGHALDSATLSASGKSIEVGSDGLLSAADAETLVKAPGGDSPRQGSEPVTLKVRYVEAGADKVGGGRYLMSYRWEGGGLFHGRSLRLTGWRRG